MTTDKESILVVLLHCEMRSDLYLWAIYIGALLPVEEHLRVREQLACEVSLFHLNVASQFLSLCLVVCLVLVGLLWLV